MNLIISNHTISQDKNGFLSLNDLHKVSGGASKHQPSNFMRNAETQELIKEIELEKSNSSNLMSIAYTTTEGKKGGTFVCRELVYRYAMWISPKFSLMVIRAFDALNTGAIPCLDNDTLSTKEERKPLVKAVNMLVDKSNLNYDEAWNLVHQYFNTKPVSKLKSYQIKEAVAYIHGLIVANAQKTNQKQKVDDEFLFDTLAHAAEYLKEYANTIYVLSNLRFTSDKLATNMTKFVGDCFTDMVKLSQDMDLRNQAGRPMFEQRRINFYHGAALTW